MIRYARRLHTYQAVNEMKNFIYILLFLYAAIAVLTIIFFNGTGDSGDSIHHYLYAKYAPVHPELFFDHWAKPFFVLLACPFAQFGFMGMKVFNALVSLLTIFLTYKISLELNIKNAAVVVVMMIFAPLYYVLTFSGLTEPLFALMIAASVYFAIKNKYMLACLLISFLPFVRSEGLIIIGVFGIYLLWKKQWKPIPFLLFGSIIYSVAGYFVHHDLLWIFTKIPYAELSSTYGSGKLFHFGDQLMYVVGIPVYFLFWIGLISIIRRTVLMKISPEELILIFIGFACFFIAHSLFWYFGIFNSMGLKRVLIGVMPLAAIIALQGFNLITEEILGGKRVLRLIFQGLFIGYIVLFPFTSNPAAIKWKTDMMLGQDQQSAQKSADFIISTAGSDYRIICAHPYLSEALDLDWFDQSKRLDLTRANIDKMQAGDYIIWENWFAVVESKISIEDLDNNAGLIKLFNIKTEQKGREVIYAIYTKNEDD